MFAASKTAGAVSAAPPASSDPQFNYVSLLLNDTGTNGQQNNTFLDSSSNNFTITRNGTPTQGSVTPYWPDGQWSNQFSGSGQYLAYPANAAFNFGTGDFTIECWFYITGNAALNNNSTRDGCVFGLSSGASLAGSLIVLGDSTTTGTGLQLFKSTNTVTNVSATVSISQNAWHHVAVTRSGSSVRLFLDGSQVGTTVTSSTIWGSSTFTPYAGANQATGYVDHFPGYISNMRVVKGTALYTSNFTPSTTPLTAVSGTSLLTCQSNRFKDNSSNNFAITVTGTPTVQAFEPFEPASSYGVSNGGSGYFNGSTDYLTLPSNSAWSYGTADFTVECWLYKAATGGMAVLDSNGFGTPGTFGFLVNDTQIIGYQTNSTAFTFTYTLPRNSWQHVAFVRQSSVIYLYVNGVLIGSLACTNNFVTVNLLNIGRNPGGNNSFWNGYISNLRVVKAAVYTSAFTPPTFPVTAITGTSLLLNCTNAGIYDAATLNDLVTVGNAQVSTAQAKFGSSSMAFDGTGDYLTAPDNPIFTLGAGNWTIESWIYTGVSSGNQAIIGQCSSSGGANTGSFVLYASVGGYPRIMVGVGSNWQWAQSSTLLPLNQWVHLAGVRNGATITIYVNGVSSGTYAISTNSINDSTYSVAVGRTGEYAGEYLNGYIDDLRITKGYARYTANFTPPTAPFPTR